MAFKTLIHALAVSALVVGAVGQAAPRDVRALIVTGGHDYDRHGFDTLWRGFGNISIRIVTHPDAHKWFEADRAKEYDVLVFYDMHQEISAEARQNLLELLRKGKGLVVMHHALADYQDWDEWLEVVGGRFRLQETERDGVRRPPSTWKDGVAFRVRVASPKHPVVRNVRDFDILDETYGDLDILRTVAPLLRTDEPSSSPIIAWAHTYGRARVVALQSGHDRTAWENPQFRRILYQAILWAARRRVP